MKRIGLFGALLFVLLCLAFPGSGHAASATTHIYLDGGELSLTADAQVQNVKGSVMVPLRLVAEQLSYSVKWDNSSKTVTIERGGIELKLVINNTTAEVAGAPVHLTAPPILSGGTTLVPLRFIGEGTGTIVGWDNISKTVYLTSPTPEITETIVTEPNHSLPPENGTEVNDTIPADPGNPVNTGTPEVTNISFVDNRLIIAMVGNVTPSIFTMTGKDRIVIDLPNTRFSANFTQFTTSGAKQNGQFSVTGYSGISTVRYSIFSSSPPSVRVVLDLDTPLPYTLVNDNDGLIIVDLNQSANFSPASPSAPVITPANPLTGASSKKLVVIDPGHGGKDPGGISLNKRYEKNFTLPVALIIQTLLKDDPNIEVVLTRSSDVYPTLQERAKLANSLNAALFVSIHANSIPDGTKSNPSGSETYYSREDSREFAEVIHKSLVPATTLPDRGIRKSSLYVTRETTMPSVLVECGYLSNSKDETLIYTGEFQQRVAEAIVNGIQEYLGF